MNTHVVQYYEGLRVVYELESRVHDLQSATENNDAGSQSTPESASPNPQDSPNGEPPAGEPIVRPTRPGESRTRRAAGATVAAGNQSGAGLRHQPPRGAGSQISLAVLADAGDPGDGRLPGGWNGCNLECDTSERRPLPCPVAKERRQGWGTHGNGREPGMNCANHPDRERAAFCQHCGKPLCDECVRKVGTSTYCEPCLAARVHGPAQPAGYPYAGYPAPGRPVGAPIPPPTPGEPSPGLAALLGLIPGVGAMYNEQYGKGIVHLIVFAVLVSLSHDVGIFGLFVFGWMCYMVVEAYHTARARRDGTPLPNPFGLNDISERMGFGRAWPGRRRLGPRHRMPARPAPGSTAPSTASRAEGGPAIRRRSFLPPIRRRMQLRVCPAALRNGPRRRTHTPCPRRRRFHGCSDTAIPRSESALLPASSQRSDLADRPRIAFSGGQHRSLPHSSRPPVWPAGGDRGRRVDVRPQDDLGRPEPGE